MALIIDSTTYHARYYERNRDGSAQEITPDGMLLHHGGGTVESDLFILTGNDPRRRVGCNYYVTRLGTIFELAPDTYETWHAGAPDHASRRWWGNNAAAYGIVNGNRLIGVETEHRSGQSWPPMQLAALDALYRAKVRRWNFPVTRLGAHKWYAPSRKDDPADWADASLREWFRALYVPLREPGWIYRVTAPAGARIRQGPGQGFPIVTTLPEGYTFYADSVTTGETVAGSNVWVHFAGPMPTIPNPLGFVFGGIVEKVAA